MDYMIDLETLATTPDAHILSIGVVDMNNHDNTYYTTVSESAQVNRIKEYGTIKWWSRQSKEARDSAMDRVHSKSLPQSLHELSLFIDKYKLTHPWANGSCFDIIILENAYRQCDIEIPWKFWNIRDTRTIYDMAERITGKTLKPEREGTYHNALDDAIFQSQWVRNIRDVIEP